MADPSIRPKARNLSSRWMALSACAVLVTGALWACWSAVRLDREMREDLLAQARLSAEAVNLNALKMLTGSEADLVSPVYLRLKEQLACVKNAHRGCRFVYILGRREDNTVFFLADNESIGSRDESPAGQVFSEVSGQMAAAFDSRAEFVEGPVTDRWGTWVTAAIPLYCAESSSPVWMLGMDVDAKLWKHMLYGLAILRRRAEYELQRFH